MGLPIDRLVVATNVNDILVRTFATGTYEIRDVIATTSPSMDIQVSSNFERLLFDAYGRDAQAVRASMASLAQHRRFALSASAIKELRSLFTADRLTSRRALPRFVPGSAKPTIASIRTLPLPLPWQRRRSEILRSRWSCCRRRIRRNFPMRSRRPAV
jgi:hypothetical protein